VAEQSSTFTKTAHLNQWQLFLLAISFYSRIPVKLSQFGSGSAPLPMEKISRYFALVGILVACCCALVYWLSQMLLPPSISVLLLIITSTVLTGGLHEDGLADICDGFGGGWSQSDKLRIMKDSSIGAYGVLALICALTLKFVLLFELSRLITPLDMLVYLLCAHALSRMLAFSISYSLPYARKENSKVAAVVAKVQGKDLLIMVTTCLPLLLALSVYQSLVLVLTLLFVRLVLVRLFDRQIQGYTGDCLGAAQQISELCCYLALLASLQP
jgi:adenosylcobinamide-GDP ribazoletransferase